MRIGNAVRHTATTSKDDETQNNTAVAWKRGTALLGPPALAARTCKRVQRGS